MLNLVKKEISLCLHPTSYFFLALSLLVFVPNYPYEVVFFFSTLATFFVCVTARENGDLEFSMTLPVKKEDVPLARIYVVVALQCLTMLLVAVLGEIKCLISVLSVVNEASLSANLTLVGTGCVMLGAFNVAFFPTYYKNPRKVGVPFVVGVVPLTVIVTVSIVLSHATTLFGVTLNGSNHENTLAKLIAFLVGACVYVALTVLGAYLSKKTFKKIDL